MTEMAGFRVFGYAFLAAICLIGLLAGVITNTPYWKVLLLLGFAVAFCVGALFEAVRSQPHD